jgi:hypothetical protein
MFQSQEEFDKYEAWISKFSNFQTKQKFQDAFS